MAVFIARAFGLGQTKESGMVAPTRDAAIPLGPGDPTFPDVPTDLWAFSHIEYCVNQQVVRGYEDGYYHPENVVTRDQMAVYVARAFELPM
jgi:hypothetical protein